MIMLIKGKKKVIFVDDEDDCHDNSGKKDDNTSFGRSERKNDYDNVDVGEKIHDFTFSNMNDVVPCSGMLFDNLDEVERFYRDYGRRVGFEVIIRNTHRHSRSNEACSRMYICRLGGRVCSSSANVDEELNLKRTRDTIDRTKCKARISVVHRVKTDKWEITTVELEHNHPMVTPDKVQFMQRSRNIGPVARSLIETLNKSGIGPSKVLKVMGEALGGLENVGFTNQDIRNVLRNIRRQVFDGGDAMSGLALLEELKGNNFGKFFYRFDMDGENRVKALVWVDPRSANAYKNFGDVVTFDSTYRTNRYCMPFIPITGVNHHYQNILFGFALIRDEKETSYEWVLKTWLEAVDNKPPITIITDQDIALGNAIAKILPTTKHTYCSWHIGQKFTEKLSSLYTHYPEFKTEFNACVYKSLSPEEFQERWDDLVEKYHLITHDWLNDMYNIREIWIRAYTKESFAAGMTTTGRSESMNSFFDQYVQPSTGLKEFIENSQKALEYQYLHEVEADYNTQYKKRRLILNSPLEAHASQIYTKEMFRRFQIEFVKSASYVMKKIPHVSNYLWKVYLVEKFTVPEHCIRRVCLTVSGDGTYRRECKKYEHSGMICKHIICYLTKKQATKIPSNYITLRWTMNGNEVAGPLLYTPPVIGDLVKSQEARYNALCKSFQGLSASASCSVPRFNYVMGMIEKETNYVNEYFPEEMRNKNVNDLSYHENVDDPVFEPFFDPPMVPAMNHCRDG
ncbi:hypothetical protein DCAR_0934565 [Daucus carota subsp. sativus]|uniref:Protein FAR1-RELATED SEQUENCE n=1 Tax=Daucus carota subsp. sativus TaxID=79200 RepID=A0AAF0XX53_DAUCS|nr:hypothetical protein DCAR_0934565 [Daucus carota subsp. sativus]